MKKIYFFILFIVTLSAVEESNAQPTNAWDFTMNDCNGNMHNLFTELDAGNVAIIEFFMLSCQPCVDAGKELNPMFQNLKATCSSKIKFYHFGFTNSYTCSQITNWVSTNGFSSVPFDSGAVQTAYYGGMGMPTIAVVAGNTHKVLHTSVGFAAGDSAIIADSIRTFFGCPTANVQNASSLYSSVLVYPNPSSDGKFKVQSSKFKVERIEVFDMLGQIITKKTLNSEQETVNLDVPNGIYFLRGEINGESFNRKVIIQQ